LIPLAQNHIDSLEPFRHLGIDVEKMRQLLKEITSLDQFTGFRELLESCNELIREHVQTNVFRPLIAPVIGGLLQVSGLDLQQAKTCAYYLVGSYGLPEFETYPILVFQGSLQTGKSQAMKIMSQVANNPILLSTTPTKAVLRDKLGENTTAFIEEGDSVDEELISNRYSRITATASFKVATSPSVWRDGSAKFFGATVLHKRSPFKDPATGSRSILIKTIPRKGDWEKDLLLKGVNHDGLKALWTEARNYLRDCPGRGRVGEVWQPLVAVAIALEDHNWIAHALREQERAAESLRFGQQFELDQAVISALLALKNETEDGQLLALSKIREWIYGEYDWRTNTWGIGSQLRQFDFMVKKSHGQQKVEVDKELLAKVAAEFGIED
jgi:hypothetical protein